MVRRFLTTVLVFLLPTLALADAAADRRIDALMVKSGLHKQVAQYEPMMQQGVEQAQKAPGSAIGPADLARLKAAVKTAFAPDRMRAEVRKVIAAELPDVDQDAVMQWLDSDLGRRITRLEEEVGESATLGDAEKREADMKKLFAALPPERIERLKRVSTAINAAEGMAQTMVNSALAVAYGIAISTPPGGTEAVDLLRKRFAAQRPQIVAVMEQHAAVAFGYVYRTLTNEELDRYIAFMESPPGRTYHEVTHNATDRAFTQASLRMGMAFGAKERTPQQKS